MKIALFTETYLPTINGVVTHVKTLKEGLEALGHKVLVVTADSSVKKHQTSDDVMYCPAIRLKKIYNYDVASPISIERLKMIKEFSPDIIHIHNEFGIGISGIVISKMLKVPLVYTLHTMYDDYIYYVANKRFTNSFLTKATHKYAKALAGAAGALTGPSKKVEEYFKSCGVKKKVNVIPNSVELDKFCIDNVDVVARETMRKKFGFAEDDTVFCFCGRLGKEKNITLLLEYWAETVKHDDKLKLLILGDGPLHEQHQQEAIDLAVDDMVVFAGRVEHDDLPVYYACGNAYITASLSDTCSISMLEGMAMNLPVLSLTDKLNEGQVVDGVNGYNFENATEMYALLKKIQAMPSEELLQFGVQTRESIKTAGAERLARSILEVYETVISEKTQKEIDKRSKYKGKTYKVKKPIKKPVRKVSVKKKDN